MNSSQNVENSKGLSRRKQ